MTENAVTGQTPAPLEHTVRLLYPFWLDAGGLDKAVEALCQLRHQGHKETAKKTWHEAQSIPTLYREEILPLVTNVVFGFRQGTHRYLRIDAETLSHWFPGDGQMVPKPPKAGDKQSHPHYALKPAGEGIELFLSPHGVGLLSLTFESKLGGTPYLQAFNHRLSQLRRPTAFRYQVPLDARSTQPPPAPDAPFAQRLGARGGFFLLEELVDFLLEPLHKDFGLQAIQQQFSVYSVTRFDKQAKFTDTECHDRLKPFLAALAHLEEATHQGSLGLHQQVLNPKHWAAVGSLGAAHLVADQDPPHPFDQQRLSRSLYKYFVPYLCAILQRQTLQRLLWETDQAILETDGSLPERQAKLRRLHQDMLRFSVQGCFTEVSSREVHNQYYELAQQGLRVAQSLQLVQRVLRDLESDSTTEFQQKANRHTQELSKDVASNVGLLADVQGKVEWLEVFFVSYYAMALAHYVSEDFFTPAYAHWSVVAAPFISGIVALLFIKPYAGQPAAHEPTGSHKAGGGKQAKKRGSWLFLGTMSLLFVVWVAVGHCCFLAEHHAIDGASFLCAGGADCGPSASKGTI